MTSRSIRLALATLVLIGCESNESPNEIAKGAKPSGYLKVGTLATLIGENGVAVQVINMPLRVFVGKDRLKEIPTGSVSLPTGTPVTVIVDQRMEEGATGPHMVHVVIKEGEYEGVGGDVLRKNLRIEK